MKKRARKTSTRKKTAAKTSRKVSTAKKTTRSQTKKPKKNFAAKVSMSEKPSTGKPLPANPAEISDSRLVSVSYAAGKTISRISKFASKTTNAIQSAAQKVIQSAKRRSKP